MATNRPLFNKRASERLNSPDDLDKFVRVTNPSVWLLLGACVCLLIGLLSWGFFGFVETHERMEGCVVGGRAMCFTDATAHTEVVVGDEAVVDGSRMKVKSVSPRPLTRDEVDAILGSEFLSDTLVPNRWAYLIEFDGMTSGLMEGVPLTFDVTTNRVSPISLVFGTDSNE